MLDTTCAESLRCFFCEGKGVKLHPLIMSGRIDKQLRPQTLNPHAKGTLRSRLRVQEGVVAQASAYLHRLWVFVDIGYSRMGSLASCLLCLI